MLIHISVKRQPDYYTVYVYVYYALDAYANS